MDIEKTPLEGLVVVKLQVFGDARGFFMERFNAPKFAAAGLPDVFPQDNHSRSAPGVLRGLHYQYDAPQGKLVGVTAGRIWDVAVDIRAGSPSYGQHFGIELTAEEGTLLWMPPGFAHGFCVLGEQPADVLYKVTAVYNAEGEEGIAFDDPELAVPWPIPLEEAVISERDKAGKRFAEYTAAPRF